MVLFDTSWNTMTRLAVLIGASQLGPQSPFFLILSFPHVSTPMFAFGSKNLPSLKCRLVFLLLTQRFLSSRGNHLCSLLPSLPRGPHLAKDGRGRPKMHYPPFSPPKKLPKNWVRKTALRKLAAAWRRNSYIRVKTYCSTMNMRFFLSELISKGARPGYVVEADTLNVFPYSPAENKSLEMRRSRYRSLISGRTPYRRRLHSYTPCKPGSEANAQFPKQLNIH